MVAAGAVEVDAGAGGDAGLGEHAGAEGLGVFATVLDVGVEVEGAVGGSEGGKAGGRQGGEEVVTGMAIAGDIGLATPSSHSIAPSAAIWEMCGALMNMFCAKPSTGRLTGPVGSTIQPTRQPVMLKYLREAVDDDRSFG